MFILTDGRENGHMWDTGRRLTCPGQPDGSTVFFVIPGRKKPIPMPVENGEVAVPDEAWQQPRRFEAFLFALDDTGGYTRFSRTITVKYAPRPDNYAYTPTEVQDWHTLFDRMDELESTGVQEAVDAYLSENPPAGGATDEEAEQIRANAAAVDALERTKLSATELPAAINAALAAAKESGEFEGEKGNDGVSVLSAALTLVE